MARPERGELSVLISLLALEITKQGSSGYRQRLTAIRDKLLASSLRGKPHRATVTCPTSGSMPGKGIPLSWMTTWSSWWKTSSRCEDRGQVAALPASKNERGVMSM